MNFNLNSEFNLIIIHEFNLYTALV